MRLKLSMSQKQMAIQIIRNNKGFIRTSTAIKKRIHPRTLYSLRETGVLEQISYGLYKLRGKKILHPDLVTVSLRVPHGVICLISALAFHRLTTQIPHQVGVAVRRDSSKPRVNYPPISIHQFSQKSFSSGIGRHLLDQTVVKIYNPEKTIIDCFKFRNKIGKAIIMEAFELYFKRKKNNPEKFIKYAKICRVENAIRPYIESLI